MSETANDLHAVYIDGETKTGKGAASKAIARVLQEEGYKVYYDVAGDFYRRYVALVRQQLGLSETDALTTGDALLEAAQAVHASKQAFNPDQDLGNLQRPIISQSVSVLGELPLAQQAGAEWWNMTLKLAVEAGSEVLVVDGRNPRNRVRDAMAETGITVTTALDLFMTCDPAEAARRMLRIKGVLEPTAEELEAETEHVVQRRQRDRERAERPFILPEKCVLYLPETMSATEAIAQSWQSQDEAELPITLEIDNTTFTEAQMLAAVTGLAVAAIKTIDKLS